jgi:hypothetical protein
MLSNNHTFTKINITGFTINPVTDVVILQSIMRGLTEYGDYHWCDHGGVDKLHKNYMGKRLHDPFVAMNQNEDNHGLSGTCMLDNGYFFIKIWDKVYPSQIQFDMFLTNEVEDLDLILDHLCASAVPYDGLGMFDYSYTKTNTIPLIHAIEKNNKNKSSYVVNDSIKINDNNPNDWSVKLNQLGDISCFFCDDIAISWVLFADKGTMHHSSSKCVMVCEEHKKNGRVGERVPNGKDYFESVDIYTSKNKSVFVQKTMIKDDDLKSYTKNILKKKEK